MKFLTHSSLSLAVLAGIALVTPALAVLNIDYVTVGNAGNAADAATGSLYGAVAYEYQISKNETTISQYAEFLNAVAKTDTHNLYNSDMTTGRINGISQSGSPGSFTYSVNPGSGNKPITYLSWFDAARFCNWLHNGQQTGVGADLTAETGAYTINDSGFGIFTKNVGATVWIPSQSEWYKAAYYDPNKSGVGVGGYWAQATQSDTLAGHTIGVADSANFWYGEAYVATGSSVFPTANALTDVGAYGPNSVSAYGTNDQAGNVWEWNDAVIDGVKQRMRGGSWGNDASGLAADSYTFAVSPASEFSSVGLRVASAPIPEPSGLVLTMLAGSVMLARRKR